MEDEEKIELEKTILKSGLVRALTKRHVESYIKHLIWLEKHENSLSALGVKTESLKQHRIVLSTLATKLYNELLQEE